jgi:LPXTG-site transpeptidase (sortase) family protein
LSIAKVYVDYTDNDTSGDISVGDDLNFTATVTNEGNVTLTNVTVDDPDLTPTNATCASVVPGGTCGLSGSYTVTQGDVDAGQFVNTATGDSTETGPDTDQVTTLIGQSPALGITKNSPTASVSTPGEVVSYDYVVTNTGNVTLTNVSLADNNTDAAPACAPSQPAVLVPGASMICIAQHTVTGAEISAGGNLSNTATANSDQVGPVQETLDIPIITIFDPPFGIKDFDDTGLPALRWTMVWINDSNLAALDAEVFDPIPAGTTFLGGLVCSEDGTDSTTTLCSYNAGTNQIEWAGTIYPDPGDATAADADNEIVITFLVTVPDTLNTAVNQATLNADLNNDGIIVAGDGEVAVADAQASWSRLLPPVPDTGFAPDVVTQIPAQTLDKVYSNLGSVWLEIPRLGITKSIVGVPIVENDWDVTWLHDKAGWLAGTAFPSYAGNSVITGHVYLPSGLPGPFVDLDSLVWDDQIIVHAYGHQYIYYVRANQVIHPDDPIATRHEEYPWITLLTCRGYNDSTGEYNYRVMVRAVLIDVKPEY